MKVSKNWIQEYLGFELPSTDELVERIGSQLGGVEEVTDLGSKYAGAVIVKVVECAKLENSDHLNLCFVDDNGVTQNVTRREDGLVQVVCGAPNVSAGVTVAWLPPGATVPSTYETDPFVLQARELRGTVSNGMLASAKELSVGDSHEGLLLLDDELSAGTSFADAYKLNDQIIEIENKMFTHRPDCFGQLGIAREVAGIFGQQFDSPEWYEQAEQIMVGDGLPLSVHNEAPDDVPRLMAVALKNVTVGPSPIWLQTHLSRVGLRPINNLVDITNYIMMLTGQPTHAYDYDKVAALTDGEGAQLTARLARPAETIELLNGKTIEARQGAIMIATNQQAIGLGGIMGGVNTEVDEHTKNVIVECANFNMYSVRRTSMAHGIFTDAVTRFNKGQSPLQNPSVLGKTVQLFQDLAGAEVASEVFDSRSELNEHAPITVQRSYINERLGLQLTSEDIAALLAHVECTVQLGDEELLVTAPFWRTDIVEPIDIVEEVGRLYGFDKLPLELPLRSALPTYQDPLLMQKTAIRNSLVAAGANELLTYSFVHGDLLAKAGQLSNDAFRIVNALSPDLQYMRYHALPSLLDKVHANIKAGHDSFVLFELNKGHSISAVQDDLPHENEMLDLVFASKQPMQGAAFYQARRYADSLAGDLGIIDVRYEPLTEQVDNPIAAAYDLQRTANIYAGRVWLGYVGEFKRSVSKQLKLPAYSAGFSISQLALHEASMHHNNNYTALPKFPRIEQDICLRTAATVSYSQLFSLVSAVLQEHKPANSLLTITPLDIYQPEGNYKQTTFRVDLASYDKTMTDTEMSALLNEVSNKAAVDLGAEKV